LETKKTQLSQSDRPSAAHTLRRGHIDRS